MYTGRTFQRRLSTLCVLSRDSKRDREKGCGETAMATTICPPAWLPIARRTSFLFHFQQNAPTQLHSSSSWSVVPAAHRSQWPIQVRTGADRSSCLPIRAESTSTSGQVNTEFGVPAAVQEKNVVETRNWKWRDYNIRYQRAGDTGPALVLIHGFGANCDHWRKNIPVLAKTHRVYAIDLLGYGYSDKPSPRDMPPNTIYTFETWGSQVLDFLSEVVGDSAFLICNSVGGIVGLQAALMESNKVRGLLLINVSLRMLHIKKQQWYVRPFVKQLQNVLRTTNFGRQFFNSVAKPDAVKRILRECYCDKSAVTDELVDKILQPGLLPGAVDVFLDFICYSGGPLPEEMLPAVKVPTLIAWGEKDPWEPVALGRAYGQFDTVEDFIVFPNVGHCPQDEAPDLVNPLVEEFVARHSKSSNVQQL